MTQKIKIVNTKDLYFEKEEEAINNALLELQGQGYYITNIVYRQNSTIIEYAVVESTNVTTEDEPKECCCGSCSGNCCCKDDISKDYVQESTVTLEGMNFSYNPTF